MGGKAHRDIDSSWRNLNELRETLLLLQKTEDAVTAISGHALALFSVIQKESSKEVVLEALGMIESSGLDP